MNATDTNSVPTKLLDIKPPMDLPDPWAWVPWAVALAAGLALVTGILVWVYRRTESPAQTEPAHVRATRKLAEVRQLTGAPETLCVLIADILRVFLEEKFNLHAPGRTTDEVLAELRDGSPLNPAECALMEDFLCQCDGVKFAKQQLADADLESLIDTCDKLIGIAAFKPAAPQPPPIP
jgi:hypothetical protein